MNWWPSWQRPHSYSAQANDGGITPATVLSQDERFIGAPITVSSQLHLTLGLINELPEFSSILVLAKGFSPFHLFFPLLMAPFASAVPETDETIAEEEKWCLEGHRGRKSDDDSGVSDAPGCQPACLLLPQTIWCCHCLRHLWCSQLSLRKTKMSLRGSYFQRFSTPKVHLVGYLVLVN